MHLLLAQWVENQIVGVWCVHLAPILTNSGSSTLPKRMGNSSTLTTFVFTPKEGFDTDSDVENGATTNWTKINSGKNSCHVVVVSTFF